ncbi:MAG: sulfatase-like hydrolase/transferase [Clostridia bacterium]
MKPNILFLMTDEQKFDTFGVINPIIKTPNLDKLISESVFFKNAYCSNPSCIPSRAAIVTGKYPTACACPTYITDLPETETTFMAKLRQAGYYTSVVGKQHFWTSKIYKGYDYEQIVDGHTGSAPYEDIASYADFLKDNGVTHKQLYSNNLINGGTWVGKDKYHIDEFVGNAGKAWLKNHLKEDGEKPWFFTLSFPGPHQPYDCEGTEFAELYDLEDMTRNETTVEDLDQKPPHYKKYKWFIDKYGEEAFKKTKRSYYANMSFIDKKVGEIIEVLKENNAYDNTVIIYSADHGDFMGEFGMIAKAQYLSEALMRVPLFVKPPIKNYKGKIVDDYVTNINIASTCLTLANAKDSISYNMENNPFSAYWEQDKVEPEDYLYMEAHDIKGIIENKIKTLYYVNRDYGELYDLAKDPLERVNLWDCEEYQIHKNKAMKRIIDKMFSFSPKSNIKWNVADPEI